MHTVSNDDNVLLRPRHEPLPRILRPALDRIRVGRELPLLRIPAMVHEVQIHRLAMKLLLQLFWTRARITGQIAGLLQLGQGNDLEVLVLDIMVEG